MGSVRGCKRKKMAVVDSGPIKKTARMKVLARMKALARTDTRSWRIQVAACCLHRATAACITAPTTSADIFQTLIHR